MSSHPEVAQIKEEVSKHSVVMNSPPPEEVQKVTESNHSNPREESPARDQNCMEVEETTSEREASKCEEEKQRKMPEEAAETEIEAEAEEEEDKEEEEGSGRERLKRHRVEMAGRVWIPETWGQETLLKDWSDCSAFDRSLVPDGLISARTALVEENQRTSSGAGIENRCS